mgnify:CR=1 FL=1|jgi:hypothetical protein
MGHKILDVKADIHEDVEKMFDTLIAETVYRQNSVDYQPSVFTEVFARTLNEDILDIVDKHFEKIER